MLESNPMRPSVHSVVQPGARSTAGAAYLLRVFVSSLIWVALLGGRVSALCGDFVADVGEECDAGPIGDACCLVDCSAQPAGTDCSDNDACNGLELCDTGGSCAAGAALDCADADLCTQDSCDPLSGCINEARPARTCIVGFAGSLSVNEKRAGREKLTARLAKGPPVGATAVGNPLDSNGTAYSLCIYDDQEQLVESIEVDRANGNCGASPCWSSVGAGPPGSKGYAYVDAAAAADGVAKIQINRRAKQTRVVVAGRNRQARGELELPTGIAAELADDSSVTLQFHSSDAECLEANLSEFRKQTAELLRVRGNGAPSAIYDFTAVESEIETFIGQYAAIEGVGAIFVHRRDGVIFEKGLGAFSKDRIYLIASSSKMVTAGVLMRLADDGLLDMDEPIVDVVGWGNHNPTVTPAQLVSNSSGLVGLFDPQVPDYVCQYFYAGTLQACGQSIFTTPQDDVQVTPPDTVFRYGGGQWQLAGAVAEVVSGKTWHELIAETYNQPCGLESLAYNNHFLQLAGLFSYPLAFNSDPGTLMPTANPNGEGGAYTTTSDYGKLLLMHLRGGLCEGERVLSTASVDRMHADRILEEYGGSTGGPFAGYGFGWWIDRSDPGLIADPGAYGAYPWLDLERDYAGLILIEADALLGQQLFNRLLPLVRAAVAAAN